MTLLPVIERELRTQSRLSMTYGLRVVSGGLLVLAGWYFWFWYGYGLHIVGTRLHGGGGMFSYLTFTLVCAIWIIVPLLTADCISREKREGTLGLLFLTPLRAREIVMAKGLAHGLRALTLWLASLPVLMIPFLMGGVSWKEAVLLLLTTFSCICWALSAGLLASSACKSWPRSLLSAVALGVLFLLVMVYLEGVCVRSAMLMGRLTPFTGSIWGALITMRPYYGPGASPSGLASIVDISRWAFPAGFLCATDGYGCWSEFFSTFPGRAHLWMLGAVGCVAGMSAICLLFAIWVAAFRLRYVWQEEPAPEWVKRLEERFCRPVVGVSFFHDWLRRKLELNPIGWLETRTWTGRSVGWGWLAVMMSLYSLAFNGPGGGFAFHAIQRWMAWLLLGSVAVSASGSFRRERETGMLELLLVSPLSERQIITGRLRGLWGQFLPAILMLVSVWFYCLRLFNNGTETEWILFVISSYLTLPVVGLYFSLRRPNFISAFLFTLMSGLGVPWVIGLLFLVLWELPTQGFPSRASVMIVPLTQAVIAAALGFQLHRDLERRNFSYQRDIN